MCFRQKERKKKKNTQPHETGIKSGVLSVILGTQSFTTSITTSCQGKTTKDRPLDLVLFTVNEFTKTYTVEDENSCVCGLAVRVKQWLFPVSQRCFGLPWLSVLIHSFMTRQPFIVVTYVLKCVDVRLANACQNRKRRAGFVFFAILDWFQLPKVSTRGPINFLFMLRQCEIRSNTIFKFNYALRVLRPCRKFSSHDLVIIGTFS